MKKYLSIILLSLWICPLTVSAEFVGIVKDDFKDHYRPQKEPLWCWASSASMALSYQGIDLPQEAIVQRVKGALVNGAGTPLEMVNATNGVFKDLGGKKTVVSGQLVMGAPNPAVLYNQLKQKKPVILTYQASPQFGHAVVLTGIDATVSDEGVQILKFHVIDESLIYKEYVPQQTPFGVAFPAGLVTGMILMNGSSH